MLLAARCSCRRQLEGHAVKTKVEIVGLAASVVLTFAALLASAPARAQQVTKVARIGFLSLPPSPAG
jgi:hypothetical protein